MRRPARKTVMPCAVPTTARPATKSATEAYREPRGPLRSDQFPAITIPTTPAASGPAKARAYREAPSNAALTVGMTVVTASASKAEKTMRAQMPSVIFRYPRPKMPPGPACMVCRAESCFSTLTHSTLNPHMPEVNGPTATATGPRSNNLYNWSKNSGHPSKPVLWWAEGPTAGMAEAVAGSVQPTQGGVLDEPF